jgi:hypothetical protein
MHNKWSDEMMLHTHGGYDNSDGVSEIEGEAIYFYGGQSVPVEFEFAYPIIRGEPAKVISMAPSTSQVCNYKLQALTEEERLESWNHWSIRGFNANLPQWDWWQVGLSRDKMSDMKALAKKMSDFAYLEGHTYKKIHFLCCRSWMGKSSAPSAFGVEAPKRKGH